MKQQDPKKLQRGEGIKTWDHFSHFYLSSICWFKQSSENSYLIPVREVHSHRNQNKIYHKLGYHQELNYTFLQGNSHILSWCRLGDEKHKWEIPNVYGIILNNVLSKIFKLKPTKNMSWKIMVWNPGGGKEETGTVLSRWESTSNQLHLWLTLSNTEGKEEPQKEYNIIKAP